VVASKAPQRKKVLEFFRVLSLCHDVIPETVEGKLRFSASSPDDEALVCAAGYFAYQFVDRRDKFVLINNNYENKVEQIELLDTIAFTSKRKRMSVIIQDGDKIRLLTKGADSVILNRLSSGQDEIINQTDVDMRNYSDEGLRCLLICTADVTKEQYNKWSVRYKKACTNMAELEKRKVDKKNDIDDLEDEIESNLILLGCTAIEDRLQDGVPECIAQLAASGINIWVLTGDKQETAINIAVACNLVLPPQYMDQIIINGKNGSTLEEIRSKFTQELEKFDSDVENLGPSMKPRALIIDGPVLTTIMEDTQQNGCRDLLIDLSQRCRAVVGCRVSPSQKREMVSLIKNGIDGVRTLAIGDGANDVPMIQEAHIGVGIKGEEGVQAVNSADYAFAQFRFLSPLVLKHGRYNYIRMTGMVCYMFYKNILMSAGQFWFNFNCGFSGQKYYTEGAIQMFNLLYTSIPIILLGIYDSDILPASVFKNPNIYISCIQNEYFTTSLFWGWVLWAIFESIIISVIPLYTLHNSDSNGQMNTFWECGATTFTICIIVINMKILFMQNRQHYFHYFVLAMSIILWFASAFLINSVLFFDYDWYMMWNRLVQNPSFWLTILMMTTGILGKDLYLAGLERNFNFKPHHILQEMEMLANNNKVTGVVGIDSSPNATSSATGGGSKSTAAVKGVEMDGGQNSVRAATPTV
jgi:phospholipid-transporting ATPase